MPTVASMHSTVSLVSDRDAEMHNGGKRNAGPVHRGGPA